MTLERATKAFYRCYKKLHGDVTTSLCGIENENHRQWYASVFLIRLMVAYFFQHEGLLNGERSYLRSRYQSMPTDSSSTFFRRFLLPFFTSLATPQANHTKWGLLGDKVPFITSGLFADHWLEERYPQANIADSIISRIFDVFDKHHWSLGKAGDLGERVVTPEIIGAVFEKYVNQKEMGAYYTPPDVRDYICKNTIIPSILHKFTSKHPKLLTTGGVIFRLLQENVEKYMSSTIKHGAAKPLPARCRLVERATADYGLISETWGDALTRRQQYREILDSLKYKPLTLELLISCNLDLEQLFYDVVENSEPQTLADIYLILAGDEECSPFTVFDPSCGSGAFIIAAIELLQRLYTYCLDRMMELANQDTRVFIALQEAAKWGVSLFSLQRIIAGNIYGNDIMGEAVEIARVRILLYVLAETEFSTEWLASLSPQITIGNILTTQNDQVDGEFDCIVGNPPYVEYSKVKDYEISEYSTEKCGNLYAFMMEKSYRLLKPGGQLGFVVPISMISTPRMSELRQLLLSSSSYVFLANFADRPGTLFNGVHQKLTICLSRKQWNSIVPARVFTSAYYHWYSNERGYLFDLVSYIDNSLTGNLELCIPKIGSSVEKGIWQKVKEKKVSITQVFCGQSSPYPIYLNKRMTFWGKCFLQPKESKEFKPFYLPSLQMAGAVMAVLSSTLFYYIWELVSDCWHVTRKDLAFFKIDIANMDQRLISQLSTLAIQLEADLEMNKSYIGSVQTDYEYYHRKSKGIIDQIDTLLGTHYGFTEVELEFILGYQRKYRMNYGILWQE